jgi:ribosomal protein S20
MGGFMAKKVIDEILGEEPKEKGGEEKSSLSACVEELIEAIHAKDHEAAEAALRSCFQDMKNEHDEGE